VSEQSNVATLPMGAEDREARERAELEQRIAATRAERARVQAEREQRDKARELHDELEREERALKDEQAIADAELEHGPLGKRIEAVRTGQGVVIVRRPNPASFRRWQDRNVSSKDITMDDAEQLVRPALVHPDKVTFDAWVKEEPGILPRCAAACSRLAGARLEELAGK
jgi:hypothetical protein